jgi:hypothetical protein
MNLPRTLSSWRSTLALTIALCLAPAAMLALPAGATAESCPNAVLRSGQSSRLPDCRAYEMVTPPYKEGFPVGVYGLTMGNYSSSISADGSRLLGESVGGVFAGVESDHPSTLASQINNGAAYLFTRGVSGWTTTAISLPVGQYPFATSWAMSSDLSKTLWITETNAQIEEEKLEEQETGVIQSPAYGFYVRTLNGPVIDIGPILPPSVRPKEVSRDYFQFAGASSGDLSAVLYSLSERHWPGDETEPGASSLYEYLGTGNAAPLLVGVSGGAGSESLISKCGTGFDAVSEDGSTVYFTALECGASPSVQELYARVDNGQSDARTVSISEPSEQDCQECDVAEGVRRSASVVGVSSDGSKVFFLTSQPLLGGDESPNIYEYDFDGKAGHRVVRVSGGDSTVSNPTADVEGVVAVSPDGSHVYFTASGVLTKTPNSLGQEATAGQSNLYLYERDSQFPDGHTVFVLPGADFSGGGASQSGRFLAFDSDAHLTSDDLSSVAQAFEYDSQTGSFVRVSIGQNGYDDDGNTGTVKHLLVANDGSVYFETTNPLVPQAVNGQENVYEYREGDVNLITTGLDTHPVETALDYISPSGTDVFFQTFEQLLPQDTDDQEDTYDARAGGGFAEPTAPPSCQADACQGPLSSAPVLLSPGSEFQAGGENVASTTAAITESPKAVVKRKPGKRRHRRVRKAKGRGQQKARRSSRGTHGPSTIGGRR